MNRGSLIIFFLFFTGTLVFGQKEIHRGILDLTENGFRNHQVIKLNGEWEFYWKQHLMPHDFVVNDSLRPDLYASVPAYWTNYADSVESITPAGYATYRLRILLPQYFRNELTFQIPVFDSSYRLYLNGKYVASNGVPGEKNTETKPGYTPLVIHYVPVNDTLEVIFQVSNYHHRRGGFWLPVTVGTTSEMAFRIKREESLTSAALGMLFAFTGFFFLFFVIFRQDRTMLYFSIATLGIMVRTLFTGSYPILSFTSVPWIWLIRMEYAGTYIAFIFSLLYFFRLYQDNFMRYVNAVIISLFGIIVLVVLTTPVTLFSYSILLFIPVVSFCVIYYAVRSFIALTRNRNFEGLLALGFTALFAGILNDIFSSTSTVFFTPRYILPHAVLFFIMMQAIILIYRWVHSYNEEKRLLSEIEFVNKNLENIVIERTTELTNQKGKLEKQYEIVESQNSELQKTIAIKNRIFSIIAHDLKSPVLNLSLMIDNLSRTSDRSSFEKITAALSQQSGFAINLIDNLLLWGLGQQNRIEYHAGTYNLTDMVLENFNLLREISTKKEITMSYAHKGDSRAICDKDLVNIILRNLLTNALKFTPRRGNIAVSVEEPAVRNGVIFIRIRDNGVGIPEDKLPHLFSEETIICTPGTENEKGTGLGLQLCHDLVRINKGTISLQSKQETGTTVTVMLPAPSGK